MVPVFFLQYGQFPCSLIKKKLNQAWAAVGKSLVEQITTTYISFNFDNIILTH
jgi:hypothetical protein